MEKIHHSFHKECIREPSTVRTFEITQRLPKRYVCEFNLAVVLFTRQYRHYLLGKAFVVRTDRSSLTWLLNFKNPQGQIARWLEELSQYDMTVIHRHHYSP